MALTDIGAGAQLRRRFAEKVEELLAHLHQDEYGVQVGQVFVGGNGGMISRDTLLVMNEASRLLDEIKKELEGDDGSQRQTPL
jgi:hypothetical protein